MSVRRRRRWPWLLVLVIAVAGGGLLVRRRAAAPKALDQSLLVVVKRGELAIAVNETGKIQPRERVEVKSKVAGQVERVFVEEGQLVKRGQPLLRLDATDYRRDVARTEADVAQAKNALEFARLGLERRKRGLESRGVAEIEVAVAENELRAKQVALQSVEVAAAAAQDRLRYTEIGSPMNGTVIQRGIQPGEVVTPGVQATFEGKPLLTVADLSTLLVKTELNQIDVAKVRLGHKATLTLDALPGRTYHATVTRIAPASTTPKGKDVDVFPIEATIDREAGADLSLIKPGMTADVRIHVEKRERVLSLPIEAVVRESGKSLVTKVVGEGEAQRTEKVEVKTGARNDREIEILSGVTEGERVMIKPASAADNEFKM